MKLNEQPDAMQALTAAVGPSIGYFISECGHGGYIVYVDGAIHCARTSLPEAIHAMGEVAANKYGKSATPPERATVVTPRDGDPIPVEDDPGLDGPPLVMRPRMRRMPDGHLGRAMAHVRRAAQVLLFVLMMSSATVWRGAA